MRAGVLRTRGDVERRTPGRGPERGAGRTTRPPVAGSGCLYLKAPAALTAGQTVFAYWSIVI